MFIFFACLALFSFGMNYISSTAISREGADYQAMKFMPVYYGFQLLAKIFASVIICILMTWVGFIISEKIIKWLQKNIHDKKGFIK